MKGSFFFEVITEENMDYFYLCACVLAFRVPHAHDEAVQLTAQEVALLLQLLDAFLQPGVLLQGDVQVGAQVGHQDERAVLGVRGLLDHGLWDDTNVYRVGLGAGPTQDLL